MTNIGRIAGESKTSKLYDIMKLKWPVFQLNEFLGLFGF